MLECKEVLCTLCPFTIQFSVTQAACSLAAFLWLIVSTWHMAHVTVEYNSLTHSPACTCNWYSCNRFFHTSSSKGNCFCPLLLKKITKKAQQWVKLTGIALFWDLRSQKVLGSYPVECSWNSCQPSANELELGVPTACQVGSAVVLQKKNQQFL
jgi:hypothetical protein